MRGLEHSTKASICALHSFSALAFCCFIKVSASRFERIRCCCCGAAILTYDCDGGSQGRWSVLKTGRRCWTKIVSRGWCGRQVTRVGQVQKLVWRQNGVLARVCACVCVCAKQKNCFTTLSSQPGFCCRGHRRKLRC